MPIKRVFLSPYTRIYIELADPMKQQLDNKVHFNCFQFLLTRQNKKTTYKNSISESKSSKNVIKSQALLFINSLSQQANLYSCSVSIQYFISSYLVYKKLKTQRETRKGLRVCVC